MKEHGFGCCLLLTGMLGLVGCAALRPCDDAWRGRDKAYHFAAGAALGAGTALAGHEAGWSDGANAAAALGVVIVVGGGKEWYDQEVKKTCWSWKDVVWDLAGGMVGWTLASVGE